MSRLFPLVIWMTSSAEARVSTPSSLTPRPRTGLAKFAPSVPSGNIREWIRHLQTLGFTDTGIVWSPRPQDNHPEPEPLINYQSWMDCDAM